MIDIKDIEPMRMIWLLRKFYLNHFEIRKTQKAIVFNVFRSTNSAFYSFWLLRDS